jgi:hypothetical protein
MDFSTTTPKYIYTALTMASGLPFSVTSLTRTSQTDANDFLFAGKAKNLTDGINIQTFATSYGYVMKAKTSDSDQNCFSFLIGYSLSLANTCTEDFVIAFTVTTANNEGLSLATSVPSLTVVSNMATVSIPDAAIPKVCHPISNNLILDPVFYNSGDPEFKDALGQLIMLNTIDCDDYKFSYS